ncbi:MAG: NADH-quinone oxidoreductase subunit NuoF [Deltaproteobacteria bacterium]|nr:NADH-quinone oxidoreductase subunit NuoF [Deltaproteobacteria bacterium]MCL5792136.1 NADH-quinone oxidoreductase subunit NuoF [Deltaproteobacteria bacterium]
MEQILFKHVEGSRLTDISNYLAIGGYESAKKALTSMTPDQVIEEVKKSGVRGRGGAGFPAGMKWSFVPKDFKGPRYLCCNADESEPGTFKDREIIEKNPHLLIEGMIIASYAINSELSYIYIRGEFAKGAAILESAVAQARQHGMLGEGLFGTNYRLDIIVHRGAGAYVCGEETGLIESIEGKRGNPRVRPPFPAVVGVFKKPTVVNNVETLASVPSIIKKGSQWYASIGFPPKNTGTKLYGISGHVKKPGVYELPMSTSLREIIYNYAGGIRDDKKLKGVIPGGSSTPVLLPEEIDVKMDFDSLPQIGSMLGSGAVIVMDESTCMVKQSLILADFYADESCGQCTPCREGTVWMKKILDRLEHGEGRQGDIELLERVSNNIMGNTLCPLGDAAAMMMLGFLKKFKQEFHTHVSAKKCPLSKE